jgi:hypothetical protein
VCRAILKWLKDTKIWSYASFSNNMFQSDFSVEI